MRALRRALPAPARDAWRAAIGEALVTALAGWPEERRTVLAAFAPSAFEAGPSLQALAALREAGWRVAYPRVDGEGLVFAEVEDAGALVPGHRGLLEPPPSAPSVAPSALGVVLVPGLAFDEAGGRLGQGGGHYDRALATLAGECLRVGICFSTQVLAAVTRDPWDEPMDLVCTDAGIVVATNKPLPVLRGR